MDKKSNKLLGLNNIISSFYLMMILEEIINIQALLGTESIKEIKFGECFQMWACLFSEKMI